MYCYTKKSAYLFRRATKREVFLRQATQCIDGLYEARFTGQRKTATQSLAWPRVGATIGGLPTLDDVIPRQVQHGTCEAAILLHEGQELYAEAGAQIKVETVDAISTEFFATPDATTAPRVDAILAPVLKPSGACSIMIAWGERMADYSRQIRNTRKLIAKKGQAMIFVEVTTGKNPDMGRTETTKTESNFFGVKTSPKSDEVQAGLYASDTVLVLAAGGSIPRPDTLADGCG